MLSLLHVAETNVEEVWTCRAIDCHVTYKGRRKVKNTFTKHNIQSVIEEVD